MNRPLVPDMWLAFRHAHARTARGPGSGNNAGPELRGWSPLIGKPAEDPSAVSIALVLRPC